MTMSTSGQIQPDGYTCTSSFMRTHNNSTDITVRTVTCGAGFQSAYAHWYDLSVDIALAGSFSTLKCVDFSYWASTAAGDQPIFIRVYEDQTPGRDGQCTQQGYGDPSDPGPDVGGRVLLWEGETIFPQSAEGIAGNSPPRSDGDRSIQVGPDVDENGLPDGILLSPNIQFFVEVGDMGEGLSRFGANTMGETGDTEGPSSANVTWTRNPNCNGGGCLTSGGIDGGDYAKQTEWFGGNQDVVMQVHIDIGDCTSCAPSLPFCSTDITGSDGERDDQTDVLDLLALLGTWGDLSPPRPLGDVAPPLRGDNRVDVTDLLEMLGAWGPCPNPNAECRAILISVNGLGKVSDGLHPFVIDGTIDGPLRPATNDMKSIINGSSFCGWFDYGVDALPGGFRWSDAFGIDASDNSVGGDIWFRYIADCDGPVTISTQSDCGPDEIKDTNLEVYTFPGCPSDWTQLIACDDSLGSGCGDHASLELEVTASESYIIRIGGKLGEQGRGTLSIQSDPSGLPDCNNNGIRDDFELCKGTSRDCNNNLIPDECETDCNDNGLFDECDISRGNSEDCDSNGIPDECEGDCDKNGVNDICQAQFLAGSGALSPFGSGAPQSVLFTDLPEMLSQITISIFASADLAASTQAVDLYIDGTFITTAFTDTAGPCTIPGDREDFVFGRAFFIPLYTLDGNTDALIELVPVGVIDETACSGASFIEVTLKYLIDSTPTENGTTQDCNSNGVWDRCDVAPGGSSPDVNGNGVPDVCEG
ncbi:MAG: hypothetical protein O7G85_06760 [Planctomycetota bacterium]|nr:hypothetical protein [Planctomycetota bacterium]